MANRFRHERDVVLDRVTIIGPLHFTARRAWAVHLSRRTFEAVSPSDATFFRTVDLVVRHSITGRFQRSQIEGPALFRKPFENEEVSR
jgi:hypothetical protein